MMVVHQQDQSNMSEYKQRLIMSQARLNGGKISKKEAMEVPGVDTYHHNTAKYVGEILTRMVRKGWLSRVKPGHYELKSNENPNQLKLF